MRYDKYPGEKTYVVFHTTGTGEQGGAPIEQKEMLQSFDSDVDAIDYGNSMFPRITSWEWDNFTININTLTEEGQRQLAEFNHKSAAITEHYKEHPENYDVIELSNGIQGIIEKSDFCDTPMPPNEYSLESYKMIFLDTSDQFLKYPFEFEELLLTDKVLDILGFTEYWGNSGPSGTRSLNLGGKVGDTLLLANKEYPNYLVYVSDESSDPDEGYGTNPKYNAQTFYTNCLDSKLYFLHEMYENILAKRRDYELEAFIELTKKPHVNMYQYIKSWVDYKTKLKSKK